MTAVELTSIIAAVISAAGGAFAAVAAFRSADSARKAEHSAAEGERRSGQRAISLTATEIVIEERRLMDQADELKVSYRMLEVASGVSESSGVKLANDSISARVRALEQDLEHARLFVDLGNQLTHAPIVEFDRIQVRLTGTLTRVKALREDLSIESAKVNSLRASMARR